jgi:hypothetical protein
MQGWAKGFAAASRRRKPSPEDCLLSIIYNRQGHGRLGPTRAWRVVRCDRRRPPRPGRESAGFRARGVPTLARPPHCRGRQVGVAGSCRRAPARSTPPGSEWQWGSTRGRTAPARFSSRPRTASTSRRS